MQAYKELEVNQITKFSYYPRYSNMYLNSRHPIQRFQNSRSTRVIVNVPNPATIVFQLNSPALLIPLLRNQPMRLSLIGGNAGHETCIPYVQQFICRSRLGRFITIGITRLRSLFSENGVARFMYSARSLSICFYQKWVACANPKNFMFYLPLFKLFNLLNISLCNLTFINLLTRYFLYRMQDICYPLFLWLRELFTSCPYTTNSQPASGGGFYFLFSCSHASDENYRHSAVGSSDLNSLW